jgi:hypothetical protein
LASDLDSVHKRNRVKEFKRRAVVDCRDHTPFNANGDEITSVETVVSGMASDQLLRAHIDDEVIETYSFRVDLVVARAFWAGKDMLYLPTAFE